MVKQLINCYKATHFTIFIWKMTCLEEKVKFLLVIMSKPAPRSTQPPTQQAPGSGDQSRTGLCSFIWWCHTAEPYIHYPHVWFCQTENLYWNKGYGTTQLQILCRESYPSIPKTVNEMNKKRKRNLFYSLRRVISLCYHKTATKHSLKRRQSMDCMNTLSQACAAYNL